MDCNFTHNCRKDIDIRRLIMHINTYDIEYYGRKKDEDYS